MSRLTRLPRRQLVFPLAVLAAFAILVISEVSYWRSQREMANLADSASARVRLQELLTSTGNDTAPRAVRIRASTSAFLAQETARGEVARQAVHASLLVNRIGVGGMTALSLLALFIVLRQTHALDALRRRQQAAVQAERDLLGMEVLRRTAELTELSRHLLTAREDERHHLARELHDELGAFLTAAKLDTARIRTRIAALRTEAPEVLERLAHLNETLNSVIALKRRIIEDLRPSSLSNLGLQAALEILLREFATDSGLAVTSALQPVALQPDSELTIYRLVQEALTNVSKHANARHVHVCLCPCGADAEVSVGDDGSGFEAPSQQAQLPRPPGHGLLGMRFRVEAAGGHLSLGSVPGGGVTVRAMLPMSALLSATSSATSSATLSAPSYGAPALALTA